MQNEYVELVVKVVVRKEDVKAAKESLMEALDGDFDALYATEEKAASLSDIRHFKEMCELPECDCLAQD